MVIRGITGSYLDNQVFVDDYSDVIMEINKHRRIAEEASFRGIVKGWHGFLWLLKIILNLPASAAVPLAMGICTETAGTVAAMTSIPFTHEQMTLIVGLVESLIISALNCAGYRTPSAICHSPRSHRIFEIVECNPMLRVNLSY